MIQLKGEQAKRYQLWLALYTQETGLEPTYIQRTQAFFYARQFK